MILIYWLVLTFPTAEACTEKPAPDQQGCEAARLHLREMRGMIRNRNFHEKVDLMLYLSRNYMESGQLPTFIDLSTSGVPSQKFKPHKYSERRLPSLVPDQALIATST